jgi:hypothetical protein
LNSSGEWRDKAISEDVLSKNVVDASFDDWKYHDDFSIVRDI